MNFEYSNSKVLTLKFRAWISLRVMCFELGILQEYKVLGRQIQNAGRRLQVRILQIENFAGCQEICKLAGKSNVKGPNLRVRRFLLVLKNEVFLLVIVAKHKSNP